jgi:hypothetical protein
MSGWTGREAPEMSLASLGRSGKRSIPGSGPGSIRRNLPAWVGGGSRPESTRLRFDQYRGGGAHSRQSVPECLI